MSSSSSSSDGESSDGEIPEFNPKRMTPMELDIQLQVAELMFRSILEGKRLGVHESQNVDDWHRQVLGEAWVQQNWRQRKEVKRQMKAAGEMTPLWMEAAEHMSDIAWEVFCAGQRGERVRSRQEINRVEILEQFKELHDKLRDAYFARCGAGDKQDGFRACIAILHIFARDSEVLSLCAQCLRLAISDHDYNRDMLTELTVPMPPIERDSDYMDKGWSFLRHALDAFVVQAGGKPVALEAAEEGGKQEEKEEGERPFEFTPSREAAICLAKCLVATQAAPAVQAQLILLQQPVPESACVERQELKLLVPTAFSHATALLEEGHEACLDELLDMLRSAGAGEGEEDPLLMLGDGNEAGDGGDDDAPPGGSTDEKKGMLSGLAANVRGLLG